MIAAISRGDGGGGGKGGLFGRVRAALRRGAPRRRTTPALGRRADLLEVMERLERVRALGGGFLAVDVGHELRELLCAHAGAAARTAVRLPGASRAHHRSARKQGA